MIESKFFQSWSFRREVIGFMTKESSMKGNATFSRTSEGMIYQETGSYQLFDQYFDFHQCYLYRPLGAQSYEVCFTDKRPFYLINFNQPHQYFYHQCGSDTYTGEFYWRENTWSLSWRVQGPRKSYFLETIYSLPGRLE